ncbi:hypothetical protein D3C86_1455950 [compost metagenome]
MFSSISPPSCGALAMEKARLPMPLGSSRLTYCPAWKCMPSGASSLSQMPLMVGVRLSMRLTVPGKSRTGRFSASGSSSISASMVTSLCTVAQQARHFCSSRSKSIRAKLEASPWSISPSVTCTLQVAHRPWQQACGR